MEDIPYRAELKRQRLDGPGEADALTNSEGLLQSCDQPGSESCISGVPPPKQQVSACCEESRAAEVQGVGSSLKVTIQQSSESRAFRETDRPADRLADRQTDSLYCHVCKLSCASVQVFQDHMTGVEHQRKLKEITHLSSVCLNTHTPHGRGRRPGMQRWCDTCQSHFEGDVILHRRTNQHKLCKQVCRPFCLVCKRHFRTPRKFVEHMKSPEHKQQVHLQEALEEELITVDAVGCFEGEEEEEAEEADEEEEAGNEEEKEKVTERQEVTDMQDYNSDTTYGSSFVVPVSGFLCRLCHKFFHNEATARHTHCRTHTHYLNLKVSWLTDCPPVVLSPRTTETREDTH
ncbi:cdkn1a interacting zinc finger protein 1b [Polymixia lowei]